MGSDPFIFAFGFLVLCPFVLSVGLLIWFGSRENSE